MQHDIDKLLRRRCIRGPLLLPITVILTLAVTLGCGRKEETTSAPADELSRVLPQAKELAGFSAVGEPEVFSRNTVWDYLSQTAEIYLINNFALMSVKKYAKNNDTIKVEIARFTNPRDAWAIYTHFRKPQYQFFQVDTEGFVGEGLICFVKGRHLGRILFPEANTDVLTAAVVEMSKAVRDTAYFPPEFALFPQESLVPHSELLPLRDNMPHSEVPQFTGALYVVDGDSVWVYVQPESRLGITLAVETFLGAKGGIQEFLLEKQMLFGTHPDRGNVYCAQRGTGLCVVTGFQERATAEHLCAQVFENLETAD